MASDKLYDIEHQQYKNALTARQSAELRSSSAALRAYAAEACSASRDLRKRCSELSELIALTYRRGARR